MDAKQAASIITVSAKSPKTGISPALLVKVLSKYISEKRLDPNKPILLYTDPEGNGTGQLAILEIAGGELTLVPAE